MIDFLLRERYRRALRGLCPGLTRSAEAAAGRVHPTYECVACVCMRVCVPRPLRRRRGGAGPGGAGAAAALAKHHAGKEGACAVNQSITWKGRRGRALFRQCMLH
jgi:hypothetical protein